MKLPTTMKLKGHSDVRMPIKYEQNQLDAPEKVLQSKSSMLASNLYACNLVTSQILQGSLILVAN